MDKIVLAAKLESLRRCLDRVQDKTPEDAAQLSTDPDLQDILVLNLTRAVQLCVDIGSHIVSASEASPPPTMASVFDSLLELKMIDETTAHSLRKAVGFRNIAVHNYEEINWEIVYSIATTFTREFTAFAISIGSLLDKKS